MTNSQCILSKPIKLELAPHANCINTINSTNINEFNENDDNVTLIIMDQLNYLLDISSNNDSSYNNDNNNSFIYEIGYPLYYNDDIISNEYYVDICCLGLELCAYTSSVWTSYGNIFCYAKQSCTSNLTVAGVDSNGNDNSNISNTFCVAYELYIYIYIYYESCYNSYLETSTNIICSG